MLIRNRWAAAMLVAAILLALLPAAGAVATPGPSARSALACADVEVIGARGSGQKVSQNGGLGPEAGTFAAALARELAKKQLRVATVPVLGGYTADSTNELRPSARELALAAANISLAVLDWRRHHLQKFLASLGRGTAGVSGELDKVAAACRTSRIVLAGYSQGAMAVHQAELSMSAAERARITATVLIADGDRVPNTAAARRLGTSPPRGEGVRPYLRMVARRDVPLPGSTVNICNIHDIVCDFTAGAIVKYRRDTNVHTTYTKGRLLGQAAVWVASRISGRAHSERTYFYNNRQGWLVRPRTLDFCSTGCEYDGLNWRGWDTRIATGKGFFAPKTSDPSVNGRWPVVIKLSRRRRCPNHRLIYTRYEETLTGKLPPWRHSRVSRMNWGCDGYPPGTAP